MTKTKSSRKGLIAGISIGSVVIAVAITFGILYFFTDVFKKKAVPPSQGPSHRSKPTFYKNGWGCGAAHEGTRGCTQDVPLQYRIYESKAMCELNSECGDNSDNPDGFKPITYWTCPPDSGTDISSDTECVESDEPTLFTNKVVCELNKGIFCGTRDAEIGWGCPDIDSTTGTASSECIKKVGGKFKNREKCNKLTNTCQNKIGYA